MTSLHYRSASATDRRSTHFSTGASRVNSTRTRDYDKASARDSDSPLFPDGYSDAQDRFDHNRNEKRFSGLDRRREKATITTTETLFTRRSPKKETTTERRRSERVQPRNTASPVPKILRQEESIRSYSVPFCGLLLIDSSTMESLRILDSSLFCAACLASNETSLGPTCAIEFGTEPTGRHDDAGAGTSNTRRFVICLYGFRGAVHHTCRQL